uniref:G-protein coupled receptors family 3 profile domain-containing protein n=1 Tax=Tetraodon nigroviridis TaxID=99883 RepID=H3CQG5_TETNG
DAEHPALHAGGDVVIGGIFPLHYSASVPPQTYTNKPELLTCSGFDHRAFRWMMTMVFAVMEINNNSSLLPGVKLGYRIVDGCDHIPTSLQALLSLVSHSKSGMSEEDAQMEEHILKTVNVSYFATCTCLNDKHEYPSFLRTVPSDLFQIGGLVQMVTFMGWFWVGTIGTTDDYSLYGIQAFSHQLRQQSGCVEFQLIIPKSPTAAEIKELADKLQSSTARVVVVFAREGQLLDFFLELIYRNVTGIQWIASEAWVTASLLTTPRFHALLGGTLGFSFPGVEIPGLKEFLINVRPSPEPGMEFVNMFWEDIFGCVLKFTGIHENTKPICTGSEDLRYTHSSYIDVSQVRISYSVYKAVYAIAHALHSLLKCESPVSDMDLTCKKHEPFTSKQICKIYTLNKRFLSGEIFLCFCKGSTECQSCPEYYWPDKDKVKCLPGIEEFLSFSEAMGIVLVILSLLGVILAFTLTIIFHHFRSTAIVKANNSEISFLLLLSLKLCFLCSLLFIGQPSLWKCRLRQAAFGISFVLCLSCLLVKTIVVLFAFRARCLAPKLFGPSRQRTLILLTTAPQVCLCTAWLLAAPSFPFKNPTYQALTGKIVVECKEPWPPGFYLVLGLTYLLLAFVRRKLPDTFNEAKLITFNMMIKWDVWISLKPAYVRSTGKLTVAVEVFAILASSFGLLLCIFLPKCFILLLHPERNVKRGMTGKYLR